MSLAKTTASGDAMPEIQVVSSNGERWDGLKALSPVGQPLSIKFKVVTKTWAGIQAVRLIIGDCYKDECFWSDDDANPGFYTPGTGPNVYYTDRSVLQRSISRTIEDNFFPANLSVSSDTGVARFVVADPWVSACNEAATPDRDFYLASDMPVTLGVGTYGTYPGQHTTGGDGSAFYSTTIRYPVRLHCVKYTEPMDGGQGELSLDPDSGAITKLDVSLKTFQTETPENTTSPNPGTVCKKALLTVTAEASLAGTYPVNLLRKVKTDYSSDSLTLQTQFIDGKNVAVHKEWVSVDETSKVEAWVNSTSDAAEQTPETTDHAELTLHCKGSGGTGDLQGDLLPFEISGEMTISSDQDGQAFPECPRDLSVKTTVRINRPGHFVSRLVCTGGTNRLDAHTPGAVVSDAQGHKTYISYINDTVKLTQAGTITCAMTATHQNGEPEQLIAVESYNGLCAKVDPDLPAPGSAGEDLVGEDPDAGPDPEAPPLPFTGSFQFLDNSQAAKQDECPRNAKALVWFNNSSSSNIHYSLDCHKLGSHSGVLQPKKVDDGHYTAAALVSLPTITETVADSCTLRTVAPGSPRDHATAERTFQCVKTVGHSSGIGDLTTDKATPGDSMPPVKPTIGVGANGLAPSGKPVPPGQVCLGGRIRSGECFCPWGMTRKTIGRFRYRCERTKIGTPTRPGIVCTGGKVSKGVCYCAGNKIRKKIGHRRYRCELVKIVEPPRPRIVCTGGKISKGVCYCGRSKIRRKIGNRAYQCIAVAPPPQKKKPVRVNPQRRKPRVVCVGGKVSRGACYCGRNKIRKRIGNRKYQCVAKAKPRTNKKRVQTKSRRKQQGVICRGGRARGSRCLCGKSRVAKKVGARRFVCVPRRRN